MAQFSVKVTAKASLWDIVSGRVTGKSKHASEVNATLDKIGVAINTSYRKLQEEKNSVTARGKERLSGHCIPAGNTNQVLYTPQ